MDRLCKIILMARKKFMLPRHEVYDILFETFHCVLGGMQAISVSSFQETDTKLSVLYSREF